MSEARARRFPVRDARRRWPRSRRRGLWGSLRSACGGVVGPGQEFVDPRRGMAGGDGFEGSLEVGVGLDAVHLRRLDQRSDACLARRSFVMAREQRVLSRQSHRAFILPISDRIASSITAGTRISSGDCALKASNTERAAL